MSNTHFLIFIFLFALSVLALLRFFRWLDRKHEIDRELQRRAERAAEHNRRAYDLNKRTNWQG